MKTPYELLHADPELLVVSKAAGLLSIPDRFVPEKENLLDLLRSRFGEVFTVHRLDRETSGLLIYARNAAAHRHLSIQFEEREVQKLYHALVDGSLAEPAGEIDKPLAPHPTQAGKMIVSRQGKRALTRYRLVEAFDQHSLLEVEIETGRTHQIRVHLAAIGHPLTIDALYGARDAFFLSEVKGRKYQLGKHAVERPLMNRTSLHAFSLTFSHPGSGERMTFESEWPKDLAAVVKQLRKWGNTGS